MKKRLIRDREFYTRLKGLMLPIAFQNFMLSAVSAGDAVMLGFVSQDALGAVSLAAQIQFLENLFLTVLVTGGTIITAQYWGKGDKATVHRVYGLILGYGILVGGAFFLAALLIPEKLMSVFTSEPELIRIGGEYLRYAAVSFFLTAMSQCCLCVMKTTGHARESAAISSFSLALDTVLNAVFIFGLFGMPAMGVRGAAVSTVVARGVELLLAAAGPGLIPDPDDILHPSREITGLFWRFSAPVLLNSLAWGLGTAVYSVVIGHLGSDMTAAYSVSSVIRQLSLSLCRGLGSGGEILLAGVLGAGELEKAKHYGRKLSYLSVLYGILCGGIVLLLGPPVSWFMTLTDAARADLAVMIPISAAYMITQCVNVVVICGVFSAGGDTAFDAYSVAATMWLIIIPVAALAAFVWKWPPLTVYLILSLDEAVKLPWVYLHYKKYRWVRNITNRK